MKDQVSIRFLIGLGDPSDPRDLRALGHADYVRMSAQERAGVREVRARNVLGQAYECGGLYHGSGFWQGTAEPCMMFETIVQDDPRERERARALAAELRDALGQDAIGLVFTPCNLELI